MLNKITRTTADRKLRTTHRLGGVERLESRVVLAANFASSAPVLSFDGIFDSGIANTSSVASDPVTIDISQNSPQPFVGNSQTGAVNLGTSLISRSLTTEPTQLPGADASSTSLTDDIPPGGDSSIDYLFGASDAVDFPGIDFVGTSGFNFTTDFLSGIQQDTVFSLGGTFDGYGSLLNDLGADLTFSDSFTAAFSGGGFSVGSTTELGIQTFSGNIGNATGSSFLSPLTASPGTNTFGGTVETRNTTQSSPGQLTTLTNTVGPESILVSTSITHGSSLQGSVADGGSPGSNADGNGDSSGSTGLTEGSNDTTTLASENTGDEEGQGVESDGREVTTIDLAVNHAQRQSATDWLAAVANGSGEQVAAAGTDNNAQPELASARHQTFALASDHSIGRGEYSAENSESPNLDAAAIDRFKTSSRSKTGLRQSANEHGDFSVTMLAMVPSWQRPSANTRIADSDFYGIFEGVNLESVSNAFPQVMNHGWNVQLLVAGTFIGGGFLVRQLPGQKEQA